ncbi:MAG: ferrous iron transporter B [Acidobacteria bacterium]|nr:MAG: ferrous iron transporter B [Acidobacteriota bacterium]
MTVPAADASTIEHARSTAASRIVLLGNPNTGKTTLFNALCGARAKTSNFPGTTTSIRSGRCDLDGVRLEVVDLPGVYDLRYHSPETRIARDVLGGALAERPDVIVVTIDACNLTRNLVLVGELLAYGQPLVIALNMVDIAQRRGLTLDAGEMSRRLGAPVVPTVARTGAGLDALTSAIVAAASGHAPVMRPDNLPGADETTEALTAWADDMVAHSVSGARYALEHDTLTERLDRAFTHPILGVMVFVGIMGGLFWTLFTLASVPMDLIEVTFAGLGDFIRAQLPAGPVRDLLTDGIVGGIAGTVVFLPQICLLFFLISLLEDTGYLARAAFVMDRLLYRFGLPGQAFVPLLTAHACALPAIMSTRLIPGRRDRLATILIAPFMSCSARLPVYVLLTSLIFADRPAFAALAFAGCYLLGGLAGLFSAALLGRTVLKGRARPMVLELPTYKFPSFTNAVLTARDQGVTFLQTAGTVIVAICVVMWWLSAYPKVAPGPEVQALRAQAAAPGLPAEQVEVLTARADTLQNRAEQAGSIAGRAGGLIEPFFRPLGFDWQLTVGVLTSFLAREVFVSTMSVLVGGGGEADVDAGVVDRIRTMTRNDGTPVFTTATSASTLVFFVLAMQCLPTLAVTRKETGRLKYALLQLGYMSAVAYVAALIVHQTLRAAGIS